MLSNKMKMNKLLPSTIFYTGQFALGPQILGLGLMDIGQDFASPNFFLHTIFSISVYLNYMANKSCLLLDGEMRDTHNTN